MGISGKRLVRAAVCALSGATVTACATGIEPENIRRIGVISSYGEDINLLGHAPLLGFTATEITVPLGMGRVVEDVAIDLLSLRYEVVRIDADSEIVQDYAEDTSSFLMDTEGLMASLPNTQRFDAVVVFFDSTNELAYGHGLEIVRDPVWGLGEEPTFFLNKFSIFQVIDPETGDLNAGGFVQHVNIDDADPTIWPDNEEGEFSDIQFQRLEEILRPELCIRLEAVFRRAGLIP